MEPKDLTQVWEEASGEILAQPYPDTLSPVLLDSEKPPVSENNYSNYIIGSEEGAFTGFSFMYVSIFFCSSSWMCGLRAKK